MGEKMITKFYDKKITGVITILPENCYQFDDEIAEEESIKAKRLKRIMGYGKRYRVKAKTAMSDLMVYGLRYLLNNNKVKKEDIGAIVVVTLSQDYYVPQISNIIHGELELPTDIMCIDINSACAGYVVGLAQSFMLLEHLNNKKVLLFTGDIFNRKASNQELKYTSPPFGGDVANITVVENDNRNNRNTILYNYYTDGSKRNVLIAHEGGFRQLLSVEQVADTRYNVPFRGIDMDGSAVFNFAQKEVPLLIEEILNMGNIDKDQVDWYLFHQPNKFMLQKLAERLGIPYEKMPMDVVRDYGNSNSGTIPVAMTSYIQSDLLKQRRMCCLAGFGAGLTWTSLLMEIGDLDFCENIVSNL